MAHSPSGNNCNVSAGVVGDQSSGPLSSLRKTQRPPRSCQPCAARRVKCDKNIPCSNCTRRGETSACKRETVIVRGRITTAKDSHDTSASYEDLVEENERLREQLARLSDNGTTSITRLHTAAFDDTQLSTGRIPVAEDAQDAFESVLHGNSYRPRDTSCNAWHDVLLPSRACSYRLIAHDKIWNAWVHYAVEYPRFEEEHVKFREALESGVPLQDMDHLWLAIYFAVIAAALLVMNEEEARSLNLPRDPESTLKSWFDASMFCLHQAEFMRRWDIKSVQAIAVLGVLFVTLGEYHLYITMWTCAIRIAQKVGLSKGEIVSHVSGLTQEGQLRLWWTLIICEWLAVPYHAPIVTEADFDVQLPNVDDQGLLSTPDGSKIHPVQYHIFMARTALVFARFRNAIYRNNAPIGVAVRHADEELAEIINTLPRHLQPEESNSPWTKQVEAHYPWVSWQRYDITVVLLHHRLRINKTLQDAWREDPAEYNWARAICIDTAKDLIWITDNWDQPAARRRQWALTLQLFTAAMFLIQEYNHSTLAENTIINNADIENCLSYLDQIKPYSVIATRASEALRSAFYGHPSSS